MLFKMW